MQGQQQYEVQEDDGTESGRKRRWKGVGTIEVDEGEVDGSYEYDVECVR